MRNKLLVGVALALVVAVGAATGALAAKMLCISKEELKGETTVGSCVARGDQFAIMDDNGAIRILSAREIELMKQTNPQVFEQKAYGMKYRHLAPEIPKLPPLAVPKQAH